MKKLLIFKILFSFIYPQNFHINQHDGLNVFKWSEINNDTISINKIGPFNSSEILDTTMNLFHFYKFLPNSFFKKDVFSEIRYNDTYYFRYRSYGSISFKLSEELNLQNVFEFDSKGLNDEDFLGVERGLDNGWVGYLKHSSLTYNYLEGHFSLGRGNPYFFNFNQSLLINSHSKPFEYLWWQHKYKTIEFDWGVIFLNERKFLNDRLITFHRYGFSNKSFRFGFTEAALVTYERIGQRELGYLMPASVLLETEENRGSNSNLIWLFDALIKFNDWTFYSELLIDDFALDGQSPPQIGSSFGIGKVIMNNFLLNFEYILIKRWVGNHCDQEKIWADHDVPIGHLMGPDSHGFSFSAYKPISKKITLELSSNFNNNGRGEGIDRLKEKYPAECDRNFGFNDEKFPSSKNISYDIELDLYYLYKKYFRFQFSIQNSSSDNFSSELSVIYNF